MRPRARAIVLAVGALVACLAATACSPVARYHVLSAVFDGVPPPPGVEVKASALGTDPARSALRAGIEQLAAQRPARPAPPRIVSVHKPVAENKCGECHDMNRPTADMALDASLCDKCHLEERRAKGWDHGPINIGTCIPCHLPHDSQHEHLLAVALPQLCLDCHETVSMDGPDYHRVANFDACTACHDPHRMY